jgi:hypothetical protein
MPSKWLVYLIYKIDIENGWILICFVLWIGVQKYASKSASTRPSKFNLDDVDSMLTTKIVKKEPSPTPKATDSKPIGTRSKTVAASSKRKKPAEPEGDLTSMEKLIHETTSEVRILNPKILK